MIRNYSVPKSEVNHTAQTSSNMFLILLISLLRCVCSIKVIVGRAEHINDQITYEGSEICSKIGATVFFKSSAEVVCSCSAANTYYSTGVSDNPSCRSDDGLDLGEWKYVLYYLIKFKHILLFLNVYIKIYIDFLLS